MPGGGYTARRWRRPAKVVKRGMRFPGTQGLFWHARGMLVRGMRVLDPRVLDMRVLGMRVLGVPVSGVPILGRRVPGGSLVPGRRLRGAEGEDGELLARRERLGRGLDPLVGRDLFGSAA